MSPLLGRREGCGVSEAILSTAELQSVTGQGCVEELGTEERGQPLSSDEQGRRQVTVY